MMPSPSKQRRQRTAKLKAAHGAACPRRGYATEEIARRCLWAIGQQGRIDVDRMTVMRCRLCRLWHAVRVKT